MGEFVAGIFSASSLVNLVIKQCLTAFVSLNTHYCLNVEPKISRFCADTERKGEADASIFKLEVTSFT